MQRVGRSGVVLDEESVKDLDAGRGAEGPSLHLAIGVEPWSQMDVRPAITLEARLIDLHMNLPKSGHVDVTTDGGVVDEVVQRRESEVATKHDFATLLIQ